MSIKNPLHVSEITPEWLTRILREGGAIRKSRVTDFRILPLGGVEGFMSSVVKAVPAYDVKEEGAPESLVIKIEPESESYRQAGEELHAFTREIMFYRDVAPGVSMKLPRIYGSVIEPPAYALAMEDMSALRPGDQVRGISEKEALGITAEIGKLHARYWDSPGLDGLEWMPCENPVWQDYEEKWPSLVEHFGGLLDRRAVELGEKLGRHAPWLAGEINSRPKTIVHSDLRADNLLFGKPGSDDWVVIIDWQLAIRSMGAFDVARLTAGSEPVSERRKYHYEVVDKWLDTIVENGVGLYTRDDAVRDYRLGLLLNLCFPVHFHVGSLGATGRVKKLVRAIITRDFAAALDFDAGSVLP
ncbi:MAG: phosphotransferase [Candidatus Dadabacteria bacterium]|nr:phosphotransferase [Candidatus Dadabacteria bacterium]